MGLWDRLVGEIVDVIEWTDSSNDTLVYRFERYGNAIKHGAMLTVREGQAAILVSEGEIADVFTPGMYELATANLPILSTLQAWKHGFDSPFKAEVYFFDTTRFTDLKWGTKNPIMLRDPEFGPTRLRAFGTYEIRVGDPVVFLREMVGTDGDFRTDEISNQLRNLLIARFSSTLAKSNIPVLDLAANYDKLSDYITGAMAPDVAEYGLELTRMLVENISLPKAVEEALDRRTSMGVVGDLDAYTRFQAAESMRASAENPGGSGGMGAGIGAGMGMAMAGNLSNMFNQSNQPNTAGQSAPPPLPGANTVTYHVAINGEQAGPYSVAQLADYAKQGRIDTQTLVWTAGMANWSEAGSVSALASLFATMPPPLPQ
ncbi:MAG: SPFH domain-containing protein [Alphaproteobacteria bacterium]